MERRVQESIVSCMAQEGFEYVPAVRPQGLGFVASDQEEFTRERGFGITTWFGEENLFSAGDEDWVDPNAEIVASFSESERDAYREVLYGESTFGDPGATRDVEPVGDLWGSGCNGKAYEEVFGAMNAVFIELGPQLEEFNQRVEADPRFRDAEAVWAGVWLIEVSPTTARRPCSSRSTRSSAGSWKRSSAPRMRFSTRWPE